MIVAGSASPLLLASAGGYNLTRSLRFRSSASAYLSRTPASAGNRKTWTWSAWVKRGTLGTRQTIFAASADGNNENWITFQSGDYLTIYNYESATQYSVETTQLFRDPSAWYHIIVAFDTTQATSSDRLKIYVNGSLVTALRTASYPSLNFEGRINNAVAHAIGRSSSAFPNYFDGYIAEQNFIDGQALTPSSFGATNAQTGVWQPKKYAGTYGTNGFYLPFTDNSGATSTTIGKDFSGNSNNWTPNNISVTAGSTYDSMTDVPTLTSATASNFAVLNPLDKAGAASITNGNLSQTSSSAAWGASRGSFAISSGKWYWEVTMVSVDPANNGVCIGVANEATLLTGYNVVGQWVYNNNNGGRKGLNGTSSAYGSTASTGDIVGVALDMDSGTLTFYRNNVSMGVATSSGLPTIAFPLHQAYYNDSIAINFGQRPFAYTPPTGFVALNTFNLPTPTIGATASTQAGKFMNTVTYTGNGASSRAITGVGFQPDLVWTKSRSGANPNVWIDSNRGLTKYLISNSTAAEGTNSTLITSFDSDGFTIGSDDLDYNNYSGDTYVAWNWKANGTGVTNTAGSITSTVSANTSAGFSVVTFTGTGSNATVGHGLGVAPSFIIAKRRGATGDWLVGTSALGWTKALNLNLTDAVATTSTAWNNTAPTSSLFSISTFFAASTYVAYCFAEIAGYSKFGTYTGNGSSDGPFVYAGFRPKYVMWKRTNTSGDGWWIIDASRSPYNVAQDVLLANLSNAESVQTTPIDFLSNGFKMRNGADGSINASGSTYIFMAFAENPFKYSLAR